jgi:hypothetical protein
VLVLEMSPFALTAPSSLVLELLHHAGSTITFGYSPANSPLATELPHSINHPEARICAVVNLFYPLRLLAYLLRSACLSGLVLVSSFSSVPRTTKRIQGTIVSVPSIRGSRKTTT